MKATETIINRTYSKRLMSQAAWLKSIKDAVAEKVLKATQSI